jgi:hypothetical protein
MYFNRRELLKAKNGALLQFVGEDNEIGSVAFNNNMALSASSPVTMSLAASFNVDGADAYFGSNLNTSGSLAVSDSTTLYNTLSVSQTTSLLGSLNVTGESIFSTDTTVSGTLKAESDVDLSSTGGNIKVGNVNALTINASGEVTKIGQGIASDGQFLKWDNSNGKVVWENVPDAYETYNAKTTDFTAATGNYYSVDTTTGPITATLPLISSTSAGEKVIIKLKAGTDLLNISRAGTSDTIEGSNSINLTDSAIPGQSVTLISDGNGTWEIN